MLLAALSVRGLRCFEGLTGVPIHRLSVFIGENDSGKTACLHALELLLTPKSPDVADYRREDDGSQAAEIEIVGEFEVEAHDTVPEHWRTAGGARVRLRKVFTADRNLFEVEGNAFVDARWNDFQGLPAGEQVNLLKSIGIAKPGANKGLRVAEFQDAVTNGRIARAPGPVPVSLATLAEHLPRFERVASSEYNHPDSIVQRALRRVVDQVVRPIDPATGEASLRPELVDLQSMLKDALGQKVSELQAFLRAVHPGVKGVSVADPVLDFSRSASTFNLTLDTGDGHRLVSAFGEGTKKKLWLALLEWERSALGLPQQATFRVFDEPDVNLDYAAERRLFSNLLADVNAAGSRLQAVVCTHAMTLVDRAPANSINLIQVASDGKRRVSFLQGSDDKDVQEFLGMVGRTIGVSNSALFYERAFLVVEGESEQDAIPFLYQHVHGRSMVEDGVILVNLFTCSAWKAALGILLRNRAEVTVMLLDADCKAPGSSGHITADKLTEIGYSASFLNSSCFYVGAKEFEDAFDDNDIVAVLNNLWPRDAQDWTVGDIAPFRAAVDGKFSEDLLFHVRKNCRLALRSSVRKPAFAQGLARQAVVSGNVPKEIRDVLAEARARSLSASP